MASIKKLNFLSEISGGGQTPELLKKGASRLTQMLTPLRSLKIGGLRLGKDEEVAPRG